ncbi:acyl-CoA dehydrogenase domain-containing protein, partial [Acinetobacter sp. NS4_7]
MEAAANPDQEAGAQAFDKLLFKHIGHASKNSVLGLVNALTGSLTNRAPVSGETAKYYRHPTRMSRALAVTTDVAMLALGGELKRREMLSAR